MSDKSQAADFDSHDEDLAWIIERLVERTGGTFGVVCRYIDDDSDGCVVAHAKSIPSDGERFRNLIVQAARSAIKFNEARTSSDREQITQCDFFAEDRAMRSYRILCLSFRPSESVNLVAAVFREGVDAAFGPPHLAAASLLYPVLSRYVRLWWLHRKERSRANAYRTALDIADVGVILLDRRLELLFENTHAHSILSIGSGLERRGRHLAAQIPHEGVRLQAALQQARHFNLTKNSFVGKRQRAPLLALQRRDERRALIVTVLGLDRTAIDVHDPAVVVYVLDPSRDVQDLLEPLCNIYKLTNSESRLAYCLMRGTPLTRAAAEMNIQEATARSYLKQIFSKTSTNRQADLVRLMLTSLQRVNTSVELTPF